MRTEQEILDGNKLIAEFMGGLWNVHSNKFGIGNATYCNYGKKKNVVRALNHYAIEELKYHTSWDWLMEVIEKINCLDDFRYRFYIGKEFCSVKFESQDNDLFWAGERSTIFSAWLVVIQFIEWHNREIELKL